MERDRYAHMKKPFFIYLIAGLLAFIQPTTLHQASATIVLTEPAPALPPTAEIYPESQFGKSPADPVTGQLPLLAIEARQMSEHVDAIDNQEFATNRAPAGLNFASQTSSKSATPAVIEEPLPHPHSSVFGQKPVIPSTSEATRGIQEVALIANDLGYFPKAVFVTRNVPVRIYVTGASKSTLCLMIDAFNIRKQVRTQKIEEITFTPSVPGTYRYYCPVNGMEGTLVVRELSGLRDETAERMSSENTELTASKQE